MAWTLFILIKEDTGRPKDVLGRTNIKTSLNCSDGQLTQYFSADNGAGKEVTTMLCFNRKPASIPPTPLPPDDVE